MSTSSSTEGKGISVPNNRVAAMKCLQSLKKRFERDKQFYSQNKCFIEELIDMGYAR